MNTPALNVNPGIVVARRWSRFARMAFLATPILFATVQGGLGGITVPPGIEFKAGVQYRLGGAASDWTLDYAAPTSPTALLPAIVMIHGGGWIEGDKSSFDEHCIAWAQRGYFMATINYRLASDKRSAFPEAIHDCKCAVRWLRANAKVLKVDPERIGVYGNSAGGHLAMMLGILSKTMGDTYEGDGPYQDQSSDVCSVVSDSGVVNLDQSLPGNAGLKTDFDQLLGGTPPPHDRVLAASPASYVSRAAKLPPFLMLYGTADGQVPIKLTDDFIAGLRKNGHRDLTYIIYPGVDHCPWSLQWEQQHVPAAKDSRKTIEDFFDRTIKNRKNNP
jgi:acetyl esterase/lipase